MSDPRPPAPAVPPDGPILVVGATGNIGRHVVPALLARGARVRAFTRDAGRAAALFGAADGAAGRALEIVAGDLADPAAVPGALAGVTRAYLATQGEDQVALETGFVDAARAAGLRRLVRVSVIGPRPDHFVSVARAHAAIEPHVAGSGVPTTTLRPNWFMENFLGVADTIAGQGAIYGAAADGRVAFVDSRDTAAVAVHALLDAPDDGAAREHQVTGPEALTFAEAAERIGRGLGRPVRYVDLSPEDFGAALAGAGLPAPVVDLVLAIHRNAREHALAEVAPTVRVLTGRPGRALEAFARDHAAAFAAAPARAGA